jgi:tetratricopeptide (TPR) repeat protein
VSRLTPQQLFDRGDCKAAKERLMQIIDTQPTDKNRRLLAWCLCELNESEKAAGTFLSLANKTVQDYILAGRCYIGLERWDDAAVCLGNSLQLQETSHGYYWLAIAKAQNVKHPPEDALPAVVGLLEKAISLSECCSEAYLWLDQLQDWNFGAIDDQIQVLTSGLARHPHSQAIRLALVSRLLFDQEDYDSAASVLQPLLGNDESAAESLWYCFQIERRRGHLDQALHAVELLATGHKDSSRGPGLSQIKGELLLQSHEPQRAIACFEAELSKQDAEATILAQIGCAMAHLQTNALALADRSLRVAIELWAAQFDTYGCTPGSPASVTIDGSQYDFDFTTCDTLIHVLEQVSASVGAATLLEHVSYLANRIVGETSISISRLHALGETLGLPIVDYDLSLR